MADIHIPTTGHTIGRHVIHCADCITGMATIEPGSVDVCVTSPPYNIGAAYSIHDDRMPQQTYLDWLAEVGRGIYDVLKPDGSFFLNVGRSSGSPWLANNAARATGADFVFQNEIVWVKSISIGTDTHGHFKPITSPRYLNQNHETIFHFTKTGRVPIDRLAVGVPFKDKTNIARWGHTRDRRCAGNVWFIPYETVRSKEQKFNHPAGFPVELPLRCIRLHGVDRPVVLDPFLGAGTTLVAAERAGGSGIGFEVDAAYVAAAVKRVGSEINALPRNRQANRLLPCLTTRDAADATIGREASGG